MFNWGKNNAVNSEEVQLKSNPKLQIIHPTKLEPKKEGYIRCVCISDTHGISKPDQVPDGDILFHCGDFTMEGSHEEILNFSKYLDALPHKHKVIIAGNHDLGLDLSKFEENKKFWPKQTFNKEIYTENCKVMDKYTYLENTGVELYGYKIWGAPYITKLTGWAFHYKEIVLQELFSKIPDGTNILLTHSPPYSIADMTVSECRIGSKSLFNRIADLKSLKYCLFGHNHEGYGHYMLNDKHFINCAQVDENYKATNPPFVIDLPILAK